MQSAFTMKHFPISNKKDMSCNFLSHLKSLFREPLEEDCAEQSGEDYFEDCKEELITYQFLNRTQAEQEYIHTWLHSTIAKEKRQWLFQEYQTFTICRRINLQDIIFTLVPGFESFILKYNNQTWDAEDFQNFFEMLATILLDLGYENTLSDLRITRQKNRIFTTQRHKLQVRQDLPLIQGKKDQRFGDILICLNLENEKLCNIKLCMVSKRNAEYTPALGCKKLLEYIAQYTKAQ